MTEKGNQKAPSARNEHAERVAHEMGRCVHFNGIQHDQCRAGVRYKDVRDSGVSPYRWPCLTLADGASRTTCALRVLPTREEAEALVKAHNEHIATFLKELGEGKTCPHCHAPVERRSQVGSCIYVHPCGHRLAQGNLCQYERGLRQKDASAASARSAPEDPISDPGAGKEVP